MRVVAIFMGSWLLAEFYGYWLHVLLHSDRFRWMSRLHMDHHLAAYPPPKLRSLEYQRGSEGRANIAGLGLEWVIPIVLLIALTALGEWAIGLTWLEIVFSEIFLILYSIFLFWILHDHMHLKNARMRKVTLFKKWFRKANRHHDIHHLHFTDDGLMNKNYGIAFSFFDRLFGTYCSKLNGVNKKGIKAAYDRYDISL